MKKIAITLFVLCCILVNTVASAAMLLEYDGEVHNYTGSVYTLKVNGKELTDLPLEPIIFNDRALVPVREVFEALGATVDYQESDKSIKISYNKKTVRLQIGKTYATVNWEKKEIPDKVAPKLIAKWGESAKTMVPVRFISENVGLDVKFDGEAGVISVSETVARPTANPTPKPTVKPTATPNQAVSPKAVTLTRVKYSEDDEVVTITVLANDEIEEMSKPAKTAAGVIYVDVFGATYTTSNKIEVDTDTVKSVRLGLHDDCTRIAVDTENAQKYSVSLSADKKSVIFKISQDKNADVTPDNTPSPSPTAKPSASPGASVSPTPSASPTPKPIKYDSEKIVVLDAGHGGSDPGALGYLMTEEEKKAYDEALESEEPIIATMKAGTGKKYNEKDIALSVTKKVQEYLEAKGIKVIMTRTGDTYPTLDARPDLANEKGAVIFVSIHLNSTTAEVTAAEGIEVYYSTQNNSDDIELTSKDLAKEILAEATGETGAKSRGVKTGNLLVNRKCMMPSALIELGFMNNPYELERLITDEYQDKLAKGISNAIASSWSDVEIPDSLLKK